MKPWTVPSQSSVFQDMLGHASKRSENADEATGITTFLNKGLKIQSRQYVPGSWSLYFVL